MKKIFEAVFPITFYMYKGMYDDVRRENTTTLYKVLVGGFYLLISPVLFPISIGMNLVFWLILVPTFFMLFCMVWSISYPIAYFRLDARYRWFKIYKFRKLFYK